MIGAKINPRIPLAEAVNACMTITPLITRSVVKASLATTSYDERGRYLDAGIRSAEQLLEQLKLQRDRLGKGDAT
ncbi:hypothetical protein [Bradyrhizobium roseum]|uniref:hypothetical protein n=1 Tax=Bradyrhizobium roseum TaxID=3056648 RepID=UPI00262870CF|nr:hypothetical protein [Bradyrhizobium roseus]WKA31572.1 hypothetical protein QUH67_16055 [Bradyrhizobium roseus]